MDQVFTAFLFLLKMGNEIKSILVTGGCGFIGSNFIHLCLRERDYKIINLDALTYAGNLENLKDYESDSRYKFVKGQIEDPELIKDLMQEVDAVVHFAAESHVDRSIEDQKPFVITNVLGTQVLLSGALNSPRLKRFVHVSTDEVYGSLRPDDRPFKEDDHLHPNSPYSASKASSDLFCRASFKTYGLPVVITRCSNNYGPYQFPEKLIPLMCINAMADKPLPIYGDGSNVRDWIYVEDHCKGVLSALEQGVPGEIYNFGGECELSNLEVVKTILKILKKPEDLITFVADRPGHDFRYAMDITKAQKELGWKPEWTFSRGIEMTIKWYQENRGWWEKILSGDYRDYYHRRYGSL